MRFPMRIMLTGMSKCRVRTRSRRWPPSSARTYSTTALVMELLSGKTPVQAAATRFTESLSTLPGRQGPGRRQARKALR